MFHPRLAALGFALGMVAIIACSEQSPAGPQHTPDNDAQGLTLLSQPVDGSYELDLFLSGSELILRAFVTELTSGEPAQGGRVAFQICLDRGGPTLQMVPLPSSECGAGGSGNWVNLGGLELETCPGLGAGYACLSFGTAPSSATVGFRFRYIGQGSGIANGVSDPEDFVP
jgi:hypothetical protein